MLKVFRWVGVLGVGLACGGCSFLFVDGPPDRHEKLAYFDCTSTAGPEVVDTTMAALLGLAAAGTVSSNDQGSGAAVTLALAGTFGASAIYGIVKTQECNHAKDELRIRLKKVIDREAALRAMEAQRERPRDLLNVLSPPPHLPKRPPRPRPAPAAPATPGDLPPAPPMPPSQGELPPAPPMPPAAAPAAPAPAPSPPGALPPAPPPPP